MRKPEAVFSEKVGFIGPDQLPVDKSIEATQDVIAQVVG